MFNRRGQRLSIAGLFGGALKHLRTVQLLSGGVPVEWFDCEALCRRHRLGQATLLVFDYISPLSEVLRKRLAVARPIPLLPPVITATFPFNLPAVVNSDFCIIGFLSNVVAFATEPFVSVGKLVLLFC